MGTYPASCYSCGKTFQWFSGNSAQICGACSKLLSASDPDTDLTTKLPRQESNRELVRLLESYVEAYPDLRFSQILENFGFVTGNHETWKDEFMVEPDVILERVISKAERYLK